MLKQIILLTFCSCIFIEAMDVCGGSLFPKKLCPTRQDPIFLFGSLLRAELCRKPGKGTATDSLSGSPHWCLQDYTKVTQGSNTVFLPSGCSLWVKETDNLPMENIDVVAKAGLKRLGEVVIRHQHVQGLLLETKVCRLSLSLNSGSHDLRGTNFCCRQQTISLYFDGGEYCSIEELPSGCSCYVH